MSIDTEVLNGWKMWPAGSWEYLVVFLVAACSAAGCCYCCYACNAQYGVKYRIGLPQGRLSITDIILCDALQELYNGYSLWHASQT